MRPIFIPLAGTTDANGNAALPIPLERTGDWRNVKFALGTTAPAEWAVLKTGTAITYGRGRRVTLGPELLEPQDTVTVSVTKGPVSAAITGSVSGVGGAMEEIVPRFSPMPNTIDVSQAPGIQATRVWRQRFAAPAGGGWSSIPIFSGTDMPWIANQLFVVRWSVAAIIGGGTATDVFAQIAIGPKGHPGGPPTLIVGSDIAIPDATHVATQSGSLSPATPVDLPGFFSSGIFSAQPLEAQIFLEFGGAGTAGPVGVMVTVLSAV